DGFQALTSVMSQQFVQTLTNEEDFLGMDLDVRGLPLEAAQRLVNHHARIRQAEALALGAASQQERAHAAGLTNAGGGHIGLDELHGVVERHAGSHRATRRVDLQMDVLVRVFRFQEQKLGADQVGHVVLDLTNQKNHALLEQARVDVIGTLATSGLLDDHRHQAASGLDFRHVLHKRIAGHVLRSLPNSHVSNTHKPARRLAYGGVLERGYQISRL